MCVVWALFKLFVWQDMSDFQTIYTWCIF